MIDGPDQPPAGEGEDPDSEHLGGQPTEGPLDISVLRRLLVSVIQGGRAQLEALEVMAGTCCERGQFEEAEWFARRGLIAAVQQQDFSMEMAFRSSLGEAILRQNRTEEALQELHAAYQLADGLPLRAADALFAAAALASAYRNLGREQDLVEWEQRALIIGQRPRNQQGDAS